MRKFFTLIMGVLSILLLTSCQNKTKYDITATMFPQYSLAKEIVGDKLSVGMISPPGVDVHNYEMSSRDLITIDESKLFLYTSDKIEPQIKYLNMKNTKIINLEEHLNIDSHDHDHEHSVHYWTSFENLILMSNIIYENIVLIDLDNQDYYRNNYQVLVNKLNNYKLQLISTISNSNNNKIFYAGHNALHNLAEEVGLEIMSLVDDIKPNLDITSKQIQHLIDKIIEYDAKYLYLPELESSQIGNTILNAVKKKNMTLTILELHGFHNITKQQFKSGTSILDLIQQNISNIEMGLMK